MGLRAAPEDSVPSRFPAPCTNSSFDCGLDGKLIDFGRRCEADSRSLIHEILEFVAPDVDELGSRRDIEHIVAETNAGLGPAEFAPEVQTPHSHTAV